MKTALVFSAGGMFGAWQAGAWKACAARFQPDLIVGASIGSLNGWLVAGGSSPAQLEQHWLEFSSVGRLRLRFPRTPTSGWFDTRQLEQIIRQLHARSRPRMDYAMVATDLLRMRPRIFQGPEVTVEHLLASCALPFVFDQPWIGGRIYSDGGLLAALPVWAAVELGAERILALHALPRQPSRTIHLVNRMLRGMAAWRAKGVEGVEVVRLEPDVPLGNAREMIDWRPDRVRRWIAQGEDDANIQLARKKTFLS